MSPFAAGEVLAGRYRLDEKLEDDGVLAAWAATDQVLARKVVVETVADGAGAEVCAAFREAAVASGRLLHPNVVATYDSGAAGTLPYLVSERPAGPTLAEVLRRQGPMAPWRVITIGRQLARGLEAAHRIGVSHGAVSPAVVVVGDDDRVKLGRFATAGARARLAPSADPGALTDVRACGSTLASALLGTPDLQPGVVSARSLRPGIPPALDAVVMSAQEGGPIQDAGALVAALDDLDVEDDAAPAFTTERTPPLGTRVSPPPARAAGARTNAIAGIVVLALLAVATGVAAFVLTGLGGSHGNAPPTPSTAGGGGGQGAQLTITGAVSFNPLGTGPEDTPDLPKLYDGDATTVWFTQFYSSSNFGGLKDGDGVYVVLDGPHALHQLTVTSTVHGWTFQVYIAPSAPAGGTGVRAWGRPVASGSVSQDVTQVDLGGAQGGAVLIWITQLPSTAPHQVRIGELAVR